MRKIYAKETIDEALRLADDGMPYRDIAELLDISSPGTIACWKRRNKQTQPATSKPAHAINHLLLQMAAGNDLTPFVGRDITTMQPREIYDFLRLLNLNGDLKVTQTIKI